MVESGYRYYYMELKDGLYVEDIRERLGAYFDIAVNYLDISGREAADALISSGLSYELELQNPRFVAGMSGAELLLWAFEQQGRDLPVPRPAGMPVSQDYWVGYMLGYFQCMTGWTYKQVFDAISYADLREMYYWCRDLSEDGYVQAMLEELAKRKGSTRLRRMRDAAGLTQSALAKLTGVSYRAIQQYEQGQKDINKAAADTLRRFALVFACRIEDLMEPPVELER